MTHVSSFEPVEGEAARVLILGSMPGVASLAAGQYYAHSRNSFWKVVGAVLGFSPSASYEERLAALKRSGIALWDVLQTCVREGSLDADIDASSAQANDIPALLRRQPHIELVCFNGRAAEKYYEGHVLPSLKDSRIRYVCLPSTSPAHASMSFEEKVSAWRAAICAQPSLQAGVDASATPRRGSRLSQA